MQSENEISRVFFVGEDRRYDISSARKFGRIVHLRVKCSPFKTPKWMEMVGEMLKDHVYDPTNDYIALTGQAVQLSLLVLIANKLYGQINVLMFNAVTDEYIEREID